MAGAKTKKKPFKIFKYTCSFPNCVLEFKRKDRLDAHEYTHSHVKKFKCTEPNCGKEYITNSHLQRHKRTGHAKSNEILPCPHETCGLFFDTEAAVNEHFKLIHSDKPREFECDQCNEKFRRKLQLKQHMFAHTGAYRYKCHTCGKGFLQLGHLKRHVNSQQSRKCEYCDLTFDKWSLFMAHKHKEHLSSDLKCSNCNKEFHSKRALKLHRKTHMDLDDRVVFHCEFEGCTKFFLQKNNMLAHYKSKHENRKFVCTYDGCTSELSTKQKLNLHNKVVHLGEAGPKRPKKEGKKAERKDKGVQRGPRISTASKLFNIALPQELEHVIISGQGKSIHIQYDRIEEEDGNDNKSENGGDLKMNQLATTNIAAEAVKC